MTSSGTQSTDAADSDAGQLMVCNALLPAQDFHLTFDGLCRDSNDEVRVNAIQKISACGNSSARYQIEQRIWLTPAATVDRLTLIRFAAHVQRAVSQLAAPLYAQKCCC